MRRTKTNAIIVYGTSAPVKWCMDRIREVYELCLMGATDEDVASVMGVNINTISLWKRTHPEFRKAMNDGKVLADSKVAASLFKRATGFWIKEAVVHMYRGEIIITPIDKYYPPDSWAANKWLTVRQRTKWAEISKIETINTNINITKLDLSNLTTEQLSFVREIQRSQQRKELDVHVTDN
jgi:hypothetical protein